MTQEVKAFDINQPVRLRVVFKVARVLTDPVEVTITYRDPSGNEASVTYNGGAGDVVKDDVGVYYYDLTPDEAGTWYWRVESTGVETAGERYFTCLASQIV